MDAYRVTKVESSTQADKVAGYASKTVSAAELGLPGANAVAGRVEAVGKLQNVRAKEIDLPEPAQLDQRAPNATYAKIRLDPDSHLISIEIFDSKTNEVIRQIPSEEIQRLAKNSELGTGVVVERKQ